MYRNDFTGVSCSRVFFPAIPVDQNKVFNPRLSEIRGLFVLPLGAQPPSSWFSSIDVENATDNSLSDNTTAKWITGLGEMPAADPIIVTLGKRERRVRQYQFSLEFEVNVFCNEHQIFLNRLANNWRGFKFWLHTRGNRFIGGADGIYPDFVTTTQPYLRGNEYEKGFINIEWYSRGSPNGVTTSLFSETAGSGASPTPIENVMFYAASYPSQSSATLTWTENSGVLPTVNTRAQTMVFQNGQKLEETVQYTFNHLSGPNESEVIIDGLTHFSGAHYEILTVITS